MKPTRVPIQVFACSAILGLSVSPASAGTHPHDRHGFMIGFGLGGGSAKMKNDSKREGSGTANFRIGYALDPDLVLAFEGSAWTKTFREDIGDVTWTFST